MYVTVLVADKLCNVLTILTVKQTVVIKKMKAVCSQLVSCECHDTTGAVLRRRRSLECGVE